MSEPLDQKSTALVLRRALELADLPVHTPITHLSRDTLAEIAAELDIPDHALAGALAEHAVGVDDDDPGLLDRLVGPDLIWTQRVATGDPERYAADAQQWLESGHGLKARVTASGTVVATKRTDLAGKLKNSLRQLQGQGGLADTRRVSASAVGLDDGKGALCVAADVGDKRNEALMGGAAVTVVGGAVVLAAGVIASPFALMGLPVVAGIGALTSRLTHQATVRKITESVEETADGLARGDRPPSVLDPVRKRYGKPWKGRVDPPWD